MNELHLFAGIGGGILGGHLLGHTCVCAVEKDRYCRKVLLQRQRDRVFPRFPIWDDICTFDGRPWKGSVDILAGGFPCQDISSAGDRAGIGGGKSGLWKQFARLVDEVRPPLVFAENSPDLATRGLSVVLGDLAEMGYDAVWGVLGVSDLSGPHRRKRMWILAYSDRPPVEVLIERQKKSHAQLGDSAWWQAEPAVARLADGNARRFFEYRRLANAQVPIVAASAFHLLLNSLDSP